MLLGAEIKLSAAADIDIDAQTVELMTDMRLVDGEFCFTYILPLATDHLLVEVTFFAKHPPTRASLEHQLNQLLATRGWADAQILRTEFAELPMGMPLKTSVKQKQPVLAGMRGGALRPSSGYGFCAYKIGPSAAPSATPQMARWCARRLLGFGYKRWIKFS